MPDRSMTVNLLPLDPHLQPLVDQAHAACKTNGDFSSECVAAWDVVETMQAAVADQRRQPLSNFERYCQDRPDGLECRIYDV